ncbi:hypothetical protein [uncultured Duncaniella sp.]|uniref:hypothetical protein n=1 Tax=uncultured Duncaniella sp. TaxID=2768039 RepID=UPI002628A14A|nr:hypothetical protein [uncultured Duncaniella sp.]
MPKTYAGTYLYTENSDYEKELLGFMMKAEEIDKSGPGFEDIVYEVKRRNVSPALTRILMSDAVVLKSGVQLPKSFKVFCAKDVKSSDKKAMKVFIDCTDIIVNDGGTYIIGRNQVDVLVSYLVSAMINYIYYVDEKRFVNNHDISNHGAEAFSSLFTYVVDYITKISVDPSQRSKCKYMSAYYYLVNIMGRDDTDSVTKLACKVSGLSAREADVINMQMDSHTLDNIKYFVEKVAEVLRLSKLTLDLIVERWMWVFGTGTVFGMELFPAFATMLTDAYVGSYLNNQKTIEKIASRSMVDFTKAVLRIGADSV